MFYVIYIYIIKNNGEETEEQINNPEDPTSSASEKDRDCLPSYEESFNYPNSEFQNNKNVDIDVDNHKNNKEE